MKNNIKKIIEERGISILQLSNKIDMAYSTTHKIVNRKSLSNTQLETLIKVAEALETDVDNLYS